MRPTLLLFLFSFVFFNAHAYACGPDTNCTIDDRHYRIRLPEGHDGTTKIGAIFHAHGYRGSAAGAMKNGALGKAVSDLGLALVAVKSKGPDWYIPNAPQQHSPEDWVELDYFDAVIADIKKRFPSVDTNNMMVTGFSAGGMMVWNLICERSESFAGFAPMAGTFWHPHPKSCPDTPAHVIHIHGASDRVVPLKGRRIGPTRQGNVFDVLQMYANHGNYTGQTPSASLDLKCRRATNPNGKILQLCLHDGGHQFNPDYIVHAWQELQKLGAVN